MHLTNIFSSAVAVFAVATCAAPTPVAGPHSNTIAPALVVREAQPVAVPAGGLLGLLGRRAAQIGNFISNLSKRADWAMMDNMYDKRDNEKRADWAMMDNMYDKRDNEKRADWAMMDNMYDKRDNEKRADWAMMDNMYDKRSVEKRVNWGKMTNMYNKRNVDKRADWAMMDNMYDKRNA